jgi:hypothetical protein
MHALIALAGSKETTHTELQKILVTGLKDSIWKTNVSSNYAKP